MHARPNFKVIVPVLDIDTAIAAEDLTLLSSIGYGGDRLFSEAIRLACITNNTPHCDYTLFFNRIEFQNIWEGYNHAKQPYDLMLSKAINIVSIIVAHIGKYILDTMRVANVSMDIQYVNIIKLDTLPDSVYIHFDVDYIPF